MVDFHALRHSYSPRVTESGVSVKVDQELARHSTATLTIGRYAHARLADIRGGVPELPTLPKPELELERAAATGTTDAHPYREPGEALPRGSQPRGLPGGQRGTRSTAPGCEQKQRGPRGG